MANLLILWVLFCITMVAINTIELPKKKVQSSHTATQRLWEMHLNDKKEMEKELAEERVSIRYSSLRDNVVIANKKLQNYWDCLVSECNPMYEFLAAQN